VFASPVLSYLPYSRETLVAYMAAPVDPAAADLEVLANLAPPPAPVPVVADPAPPALPAPPAQLEGAVGGQQEQLNEVFHSFMRFFVFVLVSNLHRFCIVLASIPGGFFASLLACIFFLALFNFSRVSSRNWFLPGCVY